MNFIKTLLIFGVIFLITTGCSDGNGSGKLVTKKRSVSTFSAIKFEGIGDLHISQGPEPSLEIKTDNNIIGSITSKVDNNVLVIGVKKGDVISPTKLDIFVVVKEINSINLTGSGNITGKGVLTSNSLEIMISGSGNINCKLQTGNIDAKISGAGNMVLLGNTDDLSIDIGGSGSVMTKNLFTYFADVNISGSGNCFVYASKELNVNISGSGNVNYSGEPKVNSNISGSGEMKSN